MTRNKIGDLNNHLFEQLERLNDEDLTGENLEQEIKRANAVGKIADRIINVADVSLRAEIAMSEYGFSSRPEVLQHAIDSPGRQ